jgi:hypothetical protein
MAKLAQLAKFVGMEEGADDAAIKQALAKKMESEAMGAAGEDKFPYADHAAKLEEAARQYEDAQYEEEGGEGDAPHVVMRKMAAKFRRMAKLDEGDHAEPDGDEGEKQKEMARHLEDEQKKTAMALADRLGVKLGAGLSSVQMFDAVRASAVPASQIPSLIDARVAQLMAARDEKAQRDATGAKAARLVDAAVAGGYPEAQKTALLKAASDPALFEAIAASVKGYVDGGAGSDPRLFEQITHGGAPGGGSAATRASSASAGPDRRVVQNEIATFVIEGERFSNMAKEMADSTDARVRSRVDALLGENEVSHPGLRLIAATRLLKKDRPDMWEAAENPIALAYG